MINSYVNVAPKPRERAQGPQIKDPIPMIHGDTWETNHHPPPISPSHSTVFINYVDVT
jgi:hypothetical protein